MFKSLAKKEKEERCSAFFIGSCTDELAISKKARFPGKKRRCTLQNVQ